MVRAFKLNWQVHLCRFAMWEIRWGWFSYVRFVHVQPYTNDTMTTTVAAAAAIISSTDCSYDWCLPRMLARRLLSIHFVCACVPYIICVHQHIKCIMHKSWNNGQVSSKHFCSHEIIELAQNHIYKWVWGLYALPKYEATLKCIQHTYLYDSRRRQLCQWHISHSLPAEQRRCLVASS